MLLSEYLNILVMNVFHIYSFLKRPGFGACVEIQNLYPVYLLIKKNEDLVYFFTKHLEFC
jgi:hypothetical protein